MTNTPLTPLGTVVSSPPVPAAPAAPVAPNSQKSPPSSPNSPQSKQQAIVNQLAAANLVSNTHNHTAPPPITSNWTTDKMINETVLTIYEFVVLLLRVSAFTEIPTFQLEENTALVAACAKQKFDKDFPTISKRRSGIEGLARNHQELLLNYRTYLRGVLDELAKINLEDELNEIDLMLRRRNFAKAESSPALPQRSPDRLRKEQEIPPSLAEASDKNCQLGEIKANLVSLKTKFEFVSQTCPENEFACEYREYEATSFLVHFEKFEMGYAADQSDLKKGWQKEELAAIIRIVKESFDDIKAQIEATKFLPSLEIGKTRELSNRVTVLSKEFAEHESTLNEQVKKIRSLYKEIQRQKALVSAEKDFEHYRDTESRMRLHNRAVDAIKHLRLEVSRLDVGGTMFRIKELMEHVVKGSGDIKTVFEIAKTNLEKLDRFIGNSTKTYEAI